MKRSKDEIAKQSTDWFHEVALPLGDQFTDGKGPLPYDTVISRTPLHDGGYFVTITQQQVDGELVHVILTPADFAHLRGMK
jgi:hypothetical protein